MADAKKPTARKRKPVAEKTATPPKRDDKAAKQQALLARRHAMSHNP